MGKKMKAAVENFTNGLEQGLSVGEAAGRHALACDVHAVVRAAIVLNRAGLQRYADDVLDRLNEELCVIVYPDPEGDGECEGCEGCQ